MGQASQQNQMTSMPINGDALNPYQNYQGWYSQFTQPQPQAQFSPPPVQQFQPQFSGKGGMGMGMPMGFGMPNMGFGGMIPPTNPLGVPSPYGSVGTGTNGPVNPLAASTPGAGNPAGNIASNAANAAANAAAANAAKAASNPFNNMNYATNAFLGGMPNAGQILDQRYQQAYGPGGFTGPWTS